MTLSILHIIDTGGPGGAETVYLNLAVGLDAQRFRPVCVVSRDGWLADRLRARGLSPLIVPSQGSLNVRYLAALCRIIRAEKIDLIVAHLYGSSIYGGLAGFLTRVPVVAILHGQTDVAGTGRLGFLKRLIVRRNASRVVFVSDRLREALAPALGVPPRRCVVIPNGVDVARFTPRRDDALRRELGLAPGTALVGAIGNIRGPKAYDVLLRAARLLLDRGHACHFAIAGEGSGKLMQELLSLRTELALERSVTFLGLRGDIPGLLGSFDVYALSSSTEGFSIACVEAMASGVPVVATRSGGPEEIVQHGISGMLVPPGDPAALAEAIGTVIADRARAVSFAEQGLARARERFSLQAMLGRYAQLLTVLHQEHAR